MHKASAGSGFIIREQGWDWFNFSLTGWEWDSNIFVPLPRWDWDSITKFHNNGTVLGLKEIISQYWVISQAWDVIADMRKDTNLRTQFADKFWKINGHFMQNHEIWLSYPHFSHFQQISVQYMNIKDSKLGPI